MKNFQILVSYKKIYIVPAEFNFFLILKECYTDMKRKHIF